VTGGEKVQAGDQSEHEQTLGGKVEGAAAAGGGEGHGRRAEGRRQKSGARRGGAEDGKQKGSVGLAGDWAALAILKSDTSLLGIFSF
jgi:hypothetical protein